MLLGLDLGTTNVKALLVEHAEGRTRVVATGSAPVQIRHLPAGGVEQDIEDIWQATVSAVRQLAAAGGDLSAVQAVGVSSQGGAMQLVSGDGQPIGPAISWLDARGRDYDRRLADQLGDDWFAARIGHGRSGMAVGQLLRLREQSPALLAPPNRVAFVGDFIVGRLTGRPAHDATSLSICLLYNPHLRRADPDLLGLLGIAESQLPDLLPACEPAGTISRDAAAATGLPFGAVVSAAIHDQYAAALGCGAVAPGDVMFGAGTAWVLLAVADRLAPPVIPTAFVCDHPVAGRFGQMLSLVNGGSAIAWAADTFRLDSSIDDALSAVPAGADGIRFRPLLAGGGAGLAGRPTGRIDGLRLAHTPAHLVRAAVEGLACELARYLRFLAEAGMPAGRLVMCGGAAASPVTPQIIADVAGVPIAAAAEAESSAFGAAVVAAKLADPAADLAELAATFAPPGRLIRPGPQRELYRELFEQYVRSLAD